MGKLTTHVLDTMCGTPAGGLAIELWCCEDGAWRHRKSVVTNREGRVDEPILADEEMAVGTYELRFHAGEYLRAGDARLSEPPFLDIVPVRFGIADSRAHYHVPLLLSPFGYSTYRGS